LLDLIGCISNVVDVVFIGAKAEAGEERGGRTRLSWGNDCKAEKKSRGMKTSNILIIVSNFIASSRYSNFLFEKVDEKFHFCQIAACCCRRRRPLNFAESENETLKSSRRGFFDSCYSSVAPLFFAKRRGKMVPAKPLRGTRCPLQWSLLPQLFMHLPQQISSRSKKKYSLQLNVSHRNPGQHWLDARVVYSDSLDFLLLAVCWSFPGH
jgi:hypothetical protein